MEGFQTKTKAEQHLFYLNWKWLNFHNVISVNYGGSWLSHFPHIFIYVNMSNRCIKTNSDNLTSCLFVPVLNNCACQCLIDITSLIYYLSIQFYLFISFFRPKTKSINEIQRIQKSVKSLKLSERKNTKKTWCQEARKKSKKRRSKKNIG